MPAEEWIALQMKHEEDNPLDCIPVEECQCPASLEAGLFPEEVA